MANRIPAHVTLAEAREALASAGLEGRDLLTKLVYGCESGLLPTTGISHGRIEGEFHASLDRQRVFGLWKAFCRGLRYPENPAEIIESDWERGSYHYRLEHENERAPVEVSCWLDWHRSSAGFTFHPNADHPDATIIEWRSILLDGPAVQAFANRFMQSRSSSRSTLYQWEDFDNEAWRHFSKHGVFRKRGDQAKAERAMSQRCQMNWEAEPTEATIRERVKMVEASFRKAKGQLA